MHGNMPGSGTDKSDKKWQHARDERGLFQTDWSGTDKSDKKWLLTQAAFVEMYGRLAGINLQ